MSGTWSQRSEWEARLGTAFAASALPDDAPFDAANDFVLAERNV